MIVPEKFGKIRHETLQSAGIDPLKSGLARFIPEEGVTPLEFLALPIEQLLENGLVDTPYETVAGTKYEIFISEGILPEHILHEIALYAARRALPIFEKKHPDDNRPRKAIETKERWLKGEASDEELALARAAAWDATDSVSEAAAGTMASDAAGDAAEAAALVVNGEQFYSKIFKRLIELIESENAAEEE